MERVALVLSWIEPAVRRQVAEVEVKVVVVVACGTGAAIPKGFWGLSTPLFMLKLTI